MNHACIACGKTLEYSGPPNMPGVYGMVWSGVVFRSTGQFGSRSLRPWRHSEQSHH